MKIRNSLCKGEKNLNKLTIFDQHDIILIVNFFDFNPILFLGVLELIMGITLSKRKEL